MAEDDAWRSWSLLKPEYRAAFESQARRSVSENVRSPQPNQHPPVQQPPVVAQSQSTQHEPPLTKEELDEQKEKTFQLQNLLDDASPQLLETSVEEGVKILNRIRAPLEAVAESPDAQQWMQQIDGLRKQAVKTKTIIGVVGNTGAGKSSVINAMLDEERLVPTNCMRACTAVVTEISYNFLDEHPYRAQIEFIGASDWERELKVMFQDLLDANGNVSRECSNEDTEAGIAYAKIKAVYPQKTKEDIVTCSVEKLLSDVSHILGTTREIKETNPRLFYDRLQTFVDSKEKSTGRKDKNKDKGKRKEKRTMEFWPLIRVVRINVKSPALATGAVIVDLPGVHDSNAARAAVAEGYMKQCTGLWIVAPINRAVDDKAAKSLLGESFKRQLKMDGGFSSVTFICSKTDDISLTEAQDSLGLDDETAPQYEELDRLKKQRKSLKTELDDLKDSKDLYENVMAETDDQIEVWEKLATQLENGETVYAPKAKGAAKKRKSGSKATSRKRQRRDSSDDEDSDDSDFEESDADVSDEDTSEDGPKEPLNEEQISTKLQEFKRSKKEARTQKTEVSSKMESVRKNLKEVKTAEDAIESNLSAMCISGRNEYSKGAIQQDFASGIKELDQELAAEEDEDNFNPEDDARDYDKVAESLPVFCVSSRGYQKLCGRLEKDAEVTGFTSKEQTEIPQLQAHCEKLTETGRSTACRTFLNRLSQLLNSMTLWASSDGSGANMTAEQRAKEARFLQKGLTELESGLDKAVQTACKELQDEFQDNIFDKYETAISAAIAQSINTALHWGDKVNRDDRPAGGYHFSTYKALCRPNGVFTNAQGPHEWNVALAEPMMKHLVPGWEKTFSRRVQVVLTVFARNAATCLKKFHKDIDARARRVGASIAGLSMLQQQVGAYESIIKDLSSTVKDTLIANQKEINREFVPVIMDNMEPAYETCTNESGPGSYMRMKSAMNGHVAQQRHTMFSDSSEKVKTSLNQLVKTGEGQMGDKADEVFISMRRDYRAVLGDGEIKEAEILPRPQRLCRKEIHRIIEGVKRIFERLVNGELDDDEATLVDNEEQDKKKDIKDEDAAETDGETSAALEPKTEEPEQGSEETLQGSTNIDKDMADTSEIAPAHANAETDNKLDSHPASPQPSNQGNHPSSEDDFVSMKSES